VKKLQAQQAEGLVQAEQQEEGQQSARCSSFGDDEEEVERVTSKDQAEEAEKIALHQSKSRRKSVSAQSFTQDKLDDWKKPYFEKPQEVRERINGYIKSNDKLQVLFGHLSESAVYDVIDAMSTVSFASGENAVTQGEEGTMFYIVEEGTFDVYVSRGDGPPGKVLEYEPGAMFGELALMYNAPRAATVVATSDAKAWALDRESFQMMLATAESIKMSQYEEFLGGVPLFKHMTKYEICQLSDLLTSDLFDEDEAIVTQGEEGGFFYILEDGEAKAYINGEQGEVEVKHYTKPGEYFGEVDLIRQCNRQATVRGFNGGCSVLSVSREDFDSVLGPIRDVLLARIDEYPAYADLIRE